MGATFAFWVQVVFCDAWVDGHEDVVFIDIEAAIIGVLADTNDRLAIEFADRDHPEYGVGAIYP